MSNGEYFQQNNNNPSHFLSFLVAKVRIGIITGAGIKGQVMSCENTRRKMREQSKHSLLMKSMRQGRTKTFPRNP